MGIEIDSIRNSQAESKSTPKDSKVDATTRIEYAHAIYRVFHSLPFECNMIGSAMWAYR